MYIIYIYTYGIRETHDNTCISLQKITTFAWGTTPSISTPVPPKLSTVSCTLKTQKAFRKSPRWVSAKALTGPRWIWYDILWYAYTYIDIILLCDICKYCICIYMLTHFYDIGMYIHLNDIILVISFDTVLWHSAFYKPRKQSFHVGYSRLWSPSSPRTCPICINWDDLHMDDWFGMVLPRRFWNSPALESIAVTRALTLGIRLGPLRPLGPRVIEGNLVISWKARACCTLDPPQYSAFLSATR